MINQPKNNCETCWFTFFNTHPQLVEVVDQFYRTKGKGPLIAMRGEKFTKNFGRYMVTLIMTMKEQEKLNGANSGSQIDGGNAGEAGGEVGVRETAVEVGQIGSGLVGSEVSQ
jgi:hypothetical protein